MKNCNVPALTIEDLTEKREKCFIKSEKAVAQYPDHYFEIKKTLNYIITNKIDIGEHFLIACKLSDLLAAMGKETIFHNYFYENINPKQFGRAMYFRAVCYDLLYQINEFAQWRLNKRNLCLIK